MRIHQNGPLDKFTFLFIHFSISCIITCNTIKGLCGINLCKQRLTRIIHVNKTCAEKCRFTVLLLALLGNAIYVLKHRL